MDAAAIFRAVRDERGWSQAQLARATGISKGNVGDYESGRTSPTVVTLNRILASVGLQVRAELEPLRAALEERVDAVLAEVPPLDEGQIAALVKVADAFAGEHPYVVDRGWGEEPERGTAGISWGFDGETALRLQGLGFEAEVVEVAVVWEAVTRTHFFQKRVRGTGGPPLSWFEASTAEAQACLGGAAFGPFGVVRVRLVERLDEPLRVEVAPGLVVPVLRLGDVEQGRPDLAEVLARLRERWSHDAGGRQGWVGEARSLGA
jgi:transcriptional regulator with XRE-family HTH domain